MKNLNIWRFVSPVDWTQRTGRNIETQRHRDTETEGHRDWETERRRNWETERHRDWEAQRLRDTETERQRGWETERLSDYEKLKNKNTKIITKKSVWMSKKNKEKNIYIKKRTDKRPVNFIWTNRYDFKMLKAYRTNVISSLVRI